MALILQIETATACCSAALSRQGETLAIKEVNGQNIHAGHLTIFIQEVLAAAGKNIQEIDAVAVSRGPGSYTGLRIGVSAAKGLCYALGIPLIAVETLRSMTAGISKRTAVPPGTLLCPMIDARRMEVYTGIFNEEPGLNVPVDARIIDGSSFSDLLENHRILFFGDGAPKCRGVISHPNAIFYEGFLNSAGDMSAASFKKFKEADVEDLAYFEPYYLKEFIMNSKSTPS